MKTICNDLDTIVSQALKEIEIECKAQGKTFSPQRVNLAELSRRTGISRSRLRTARKNGWIFARHRRKCPKNHVLDGYTGLLDERLRSGVSNSVECLAYLEQRGFKGSLASVKRYIAKHKALIPVKHKPVEGQGRRARRYSTKPGEVYQMDWGFVKVATTLGTILRIACFAMICHFCGMRYLEFFPNAKQENLFIGIIHAFRALGIPEYVLTDNMRSVVLYRTAKGEPVWNQDYEAFMKAVGFKTKLCRPRHAYTKGKVERLIETAKGNLLPGLVIHNLNDLNDAARDYCQRENRRLHAYNDLTPADLHDYSCNKHLRELQINPEIRNYLYPLRKVSFDGFVSYEGRRYGVPYRYTKSFARVCRIGNRLVVYSYDLKEQLASYTVTWSHADSCCEGQFEPQQAEEFPTEPVKITIQQKEPDDLNEDEFLERFDFKEEVNSDGE